MQNLKSVTLKTLYASNMFSNDLIALVLTEIAKGANICVVGGLGVGKTALLQALCDEIADTPVILSNSPDMFNTIKCKSELINVYTRLDTTKDWKDLLALHMNSNERVFAEANCINAFNLLNNFCVIDRKLKRVFNLILELKQSTSNNSKYIAHVYKITNSGLGLVI